MMGSYFPEALPIPGRLRPGHHRPPQPRPSCHFLTCRRRVGLRGSAPRPVPRTLLAQPMVLLVRAGPPFLKGQDAPIPPATSSFYWHADLTEVRLLLPSARFFLFFVFTGLASFLSTSHITWLSYYFFQSCGYAKLAQTAPEPPEALRL